MVEIDILPRSRALKTVSTDELDAGSSAHELLELVASANEMSVNRIRLSRIDHETKKHIPLIASKTLGENGVDATNTTEKCLLYAKDLGPQASWRLVYILEYLGPIIIFPLIYYFPQLYGYRDPALGAKTPTQRAALVLAVLHFIKREIETIFVHRFSNATMPAFNIIKNCAHYWGLSGLSISIFIFASQSTSAIAGRNALTKFLFYTNDWSTSSLTVIIALWAFAELSNLRTHIVLSNLRSNGSSKYAIPYGYGFNTVACPNYFFEVLAWVAFAILVGNWLSWLFMLVGAGQMYVWAVKKHMRLRSIFGDEYKKLKRAVFIPYIY